MDLRFDDKKLQKSLSDGAKLVATYGPMRAKKLRIRIAELRAAGSLKDFWPPKSPPSRCHELTHGKRAGQLSVDLDHPYRLIFVPDHDPVPRLPDHGLDWGNVTAIKILGIEDTHE